MTEVKYCPVCGSKDIDVVQFSTTKRYVDEGEIVEETRLEVEDVGVNCRGCAYSGHIAVDKHPSESP